MTNIINYFNDGIADTGILYILVIVDTVLAISYKIKENKGLMSNVLLAGLFRNVILAMLPSIITWLSIMRPRTDNTYTYIIALFSIMIGAGIIQSILANINLLGIKYPQWLMDWLSKELSNKVNNDGTKK